MRWERSYVQLISSVLSLTLPEIRSGQQQREQKLEETNPAGSFQRINAVTKSSNFLRRYRIITSIITNKSIQVFFEELIAE